MLTHEQTQQYAEDGYLVVRDLIPAELLTPLREVLLGFERDDQGWDAGRHFQILDPKWYTNGEGGGVPIGVQRPALKDANFERVAGHEALRRAMQDILGGEVERFTDQALIKWHWIREAQAGATFWHQDSYYWRLEPELGSNCWIPLDPVGPGAIAVTVMPGSQRDWALVEHEDYHDDPPWFGIRADKAHPRHRIPADRVDASQERIISMSPGDGLFFTNYTWHRAEPNHSGETKCAYAIAYKRA